MSYEYRIAFVDGHDADGDVTVSTVPWEGSERDWMRVKEALGEYRAAGRKAWIERREVGDWSEVVGADERPPLDAPVDKSA